MKRATASLTLIFGLLCPSYIFARLTSEVFYFETNRPIFVQHNLHFNQVQMGKPVFLFLPSIHRGWIASDPLTLSLSQRGVSFVFMNFSPHPFSVVQTNLNKKAAFEEKEFTLQDLIDEIQFVQSTLYRRYKVTTVPVTFSYSGLLSPLLKDAFIIDSAPWTSAAASFPDFEVYRQWLEKVLNPIYAPTWIRSTLDFQYRNYWSKQVDFIISQLKLPKEYKNRIIEGYVTLVRAIEQQQWNLDQFYNPNQTRSILVASHEKPGILRHQLETIKKHWEKERFLRLVYLVDSMPEIPSHQPEFYISLLQQLYQKDMSVVYHPYTSQLIDEKSLVTQSQRGPSFFSSQSHVLKFDKDSDCYLMIAKSTSPQDWHCYGRRSALDWVMDMLLHIAL